MIYSPKIIAAVCTEFGLTPKDIREQSDVPKVAAYEARITAVYLLRKYGKLSWAEVAEEVGRLACSVAYSSDAAKARIATSKTYAERVERLEAALAKLAQVKSKPVPVPAVVLEAVKTARNEEILKLRKRGWSVKSLCRRFFALEKEIRLVIGEPSLAERYK